MKLRNYIILLLAACVWASCSKDEELPKGPDATPDAFLSLAVNADAKTKAPETVEPRDIVSRLTVFVYVGDHCYYKDSINKTQTITSVVNIPVKGGNATICAVANASNEQIAELSKLKTISEEVVSSLPTCNLGAEVHKNLTMSSEIFKVTLNVSKTNCIGYSDADMAAAGITNGVKVTNSPISLYRNVARVQMSKLKLQENTEYGKAVDFLLTKLFVANVKSLSTILPTAKAQGGIIWGGPSEVEGLTDAEYWYGTFNMPADGLQSIKKGTNKDYLCYNFSSNNYLGWTDFPYYDEAKAEGSEPNRSVSVGPEQPAFNQDGRPLGNFFYVYENSEGNNYPTLLVICGDYKYIPKGGSEAVTLKDRYYALVVNGTDNLVTGTFDPSVGIHSYIKRNTVYDITLNIAGPGSDTPDPSVRAYVGSKLEVLPWDVVRMEGDVD